MLLPNAGQRRQQGVNRALVHAQRQFAPLQALKIRDALADLIAKIQQALSVLLEQLARIGEPHRPGAPDEERLAQRVFELSDRQTDGRLGAVQLFGGAGETALARHGQKNL